MSLHSIEADVLEARIGMAYDTLKASTRPSLTLSADERWSARDGRAIEATADLDLWLADEGTEYVLAPSEVKIDNHLADWRSALPFSEAQRLRLVQARRECPYPNNLDVHLRDLIQAEQASDAGLSILLDGGVMLRTWLQWRRGSGERFEGAQGVERAQRSLWLAREIVKRQLSDD